jgi:hypothetical protein
MKKQPRQLCLVCQNEIKRRYGSAMHTCDCDAMLERAGSAARFPVVANRRSK